MKLTPKMIEKLGPCKERDLSSRETFSKLSSLYANEHRVGRAITISFCKDFFESRNRRFAMSKFKSNGYIHKFNDGYMTISDGEERLFWAVEKLLTLKGVKLFVKEAGGGSKQYKIFYRIWKKHGRKIK